jgi:peptidoglycan hydrolase-like protein with peptidoglycan-binding domain
MWIVKGNVGKDVLWIQQILNALGFYLGKLDGEFGDITDEAVRDFQKAYGLKVDGIVGDKTGAKLKQIEDELKKALPKPTGIFGTITGQGVNIRTGPGTKFPSLGKLNKGTRLEILYEDGSWTRVFYQSRTAYVFTDYLAVDKPVNHTGVYAYINAQDVNFRVGPGTNYSSIAKLDRGTKLEVLKPGDAWTHTMLDNILGYVFTDYLSPAPLPSMTARMADFVEYAKKWVDIGIYVWGAQGQEWGIGDPVTKNLTESFIRAAETSSSNADKAIKLFKKRQSEGHTQIRAFDCSGFVIYYIWIVQKYVSGDKSAAGIYSGYCTPVQKKDLLPGDLLFKYGTSNGQKKIYHVGIYIGNNRVIHAKGRAYGVVEENVTSSWNRFGRLNCLK